MTGNAARCAGMLSPQVLLAHYKQSSNSAHCQQLEPHGAEC